MTLTINIVSNDYGLRQFKQAITKVGLPHSDLNYTKQLLILFFKGSTFVGTGGLEAIHNVGLLRSVSIVSTERNKNFGRQIVQEMLKNARSKNISRIYLLTETAKSYFEKLGFEEIEREQAPNEIKMTTEFASVCAKSAICMFMNLQ